MNYIIRVALFALSIATITPVANAATVNNGAPPVSQNSTADWVNG